MVAYLIDFLIVVGLIIGLTALNGVITNGIGNKVFGRRKRGQFVNKSASIQTNWKEIGGKSK
ncbi:hypothetical protein R4Z10_05315 [Niallia sp. XMNu-256]|uniref:hypothetical protein n=1 Tax=Niallia sp. XMNu-256 TaxID=3082444 RepID=UPI0030D0B9C1